MAQLTHPHSRGTEGTGVAGSQKLGKAGVSLVGRYKNRDSQCLKYLNSWAESSQDCLEATSVAFTQVPWAKHMKSPGPCHRHAWSTPQGRAGGSWGMMSGRSPGHCPPETSWCRPGLLFLGQQGQGSQICIF